MADAVATKPKKTNTPTYISDTSKMIKGIVINRDPPISTGWCGNDNCEHIIHKSRRTAQKAADTKAKK